MDEILRPATIPAAERAPARELDTTEERFIAVSAALTGFDAVELTGTGMTALYLETIEQWVGPTIAAELFAFGTDPLPDDYVVRTRILADPRLGPVARNVIELWYNATWSPLPVAWYQANAAAIPNLPDLANLPAAYIVSPEAYVESLVWTAANTHPMGAKQPGFGTWADPPKGAAR